MAGIHLKKKATSSVGMVIKEKTFSFTAGGNVELTDHCREHNVHLLKILGKSLEIEL